MNTVHKQGQFSSDIQTIDHETHTHIFVFFFLKILSSMRDLNNLLIHMHKDTFIRPGPVYSFA